jgi:hypothetical protein
MTEIICRDIVTDASAWTAAGLREQDWLVELTRDQATELLTVTRQVADLKPTDIGRADFVLRLLGPVLADQVRELEHGRGFSVLRGLPVHGLEDAEVERMFIGLGVHLGRITAQTRTGEILNHVRDVGGDSTARGYTSRYGLPFHTDGTDLLALLCVTPAVSGGLSSVSSSVSVHNRILSERPELLGLLYKEYLYDKRGAQVEGESPYYANQIFGYFDGRLACRYYNRGRVESAQEVSGIALSPAERAALDLFEEFAASPELRLDVDLRAGDLMLIDNNVVLHSRTEFSDSESQRRHLMRLAVNPDRQRVFPEGFAKYREGYPVTSPVGTPK